MINWCCPVMDFHLELPVLALALEVNFDADSPKWVEPDKWLAIDHQTAGIGCHHHFLFSRILCPTKLGSKLIAEVDKLWYGTNVGALGVFLDEVLEYRDVLTRYEVCCNAAYRMFEEGIYPIDCTRPALSILVDEGLPENMNSFCVDETIWPPRWKIVVVGRNSD